MSENHAFDLVVVGSGGAALTAALTAADAGLRVVVLERTKSLGGTTATSSGMVWVPCNDAMADNGVADSVDEAVAYLEACAGDRIDRDGVRSFVEHAAPMARYLAAHGVELAGTGVADTYPDLPGAKARRTMAAASTPIDPQSDLEAIVRLPPYDLGFSGKQGDRWAGGTALIVSLLRAGRAAGVEFCVDARATEVIVEHDTVVGVRAEHAGTSVEYRGRRGVLIASGGFERDPGLMTQYHGDGVEAAWSAPANTGDGLRMAEQAGAGLANMDQVWWYSLLRVSDQVVEGQPVFRDASPARGFPGSIVVDSSGRRFTNEAQSYHDLGKTMHDHGASPYWLIFDQTFVDNYGDKAFGPTRTAPWFTQAPTIGELADAIEVDGAALDATLEHWNHDVDEGQDRGFGRGAAALDQNWGDPERDGVFKAIGPIAQAPFWATRLYVSTSGTNGGPRTDPEGRVLDVSGQPIAGLYAAGNTTASILGAANPAAGGTLGPMLTLAWRAGRAAAAAKSVEQIDAIATKG